MADIWDTIIPVSVVGGMALGLVYWGAFDESYSEKMERLRAQYRPVVIERVEEKADSTRNFTDAEYFEKVTKVELESMELKLWTKKIQ